VFTNLWYVGFGRCGLEVLTQTARTSRAAQGRLDITVTGEI
jgi:hypothetical protein